MRTFEEFINENAIFEALANPLKIEKNLQKSVQFINGYKITDGTIKILKTPIRIEPSKYNKEMVSRAKNFSGSIMYMYGSYSDEYYSNQAIIAVISRVTGSTKVHLYRDAFNTYAKNQKIEAEFNDNDVIQGPGSEISKLFQEKNKEIVNHLSKYPKDGSVKNF